MDTPFLDSNNYLCIEDIPDWYKDNQYILTKYRNTDRNYLYYLKSVFKLHNETFNIWTHIFGAILFLYIGISLNIHYHTLSSWTSYLSINLYVFSVFITFFFSSVMHTFYPKNHNVCKNLQKLDYTGINMQIFSSMGTFIYYAFYCESQIQIIYYSLILITGFINTIITTLNVLTDHRYRWIRITSFSFSIILFLVPIIHRSLLNNKNYLEKKSFNDELVYFTISTIIFLLAFLIFVFRIPEKCNPGKFDVFLHSHQIFHLLAVIGSLVLYRGFVNVMEKDTSIICQLKIK